MRWTVLVALWGCADAGGAPEAGNTRERLDSAETRIDELEADLSAAQARIRVLEERTASGDLPDPPKYQRGEVIAEVKCDEVTGPWFDDLFDGEGSPVVIDYDIDPPSGLPPVVWYRSRITGGWSAWTLLADPFDRSGGLAVATKADRGLSVGDMFAWCLRDANEHRQWVVLAP